MAAVAMPSVATVDLPFTPFQSQWDIAQSDSRVVGIFGGYGSGKSTAAAFSVFMLSLANPKTPAYGNNNPTIVVSAPTARIMRDTTMPALLSVIPDECIRKHRKADNELELSNGCVIKLRSGKSKFEGATILGIWLDEISLYDEQFFHNAVARVRDNKAGRELIIVSGIPFEGSWVEEQFRDPRPGQDTFMLSAYSNPFLPLRSIEELRNRISRDDADTLVFGRWMKQRDLVFPEFSLREHVRDEVEYNPNLGYYFGIDPGKNHSVCLVGQSYKQLLADGTSSMGVRVVDEIIAESTTLEHLMLEVRSRGYTKAQRAWIDPTTRLDELASINRVFPGMSVIPQKQGTDQASEAYGINAVRMALKDANGNSRLYISGRLRHIDGGLVSALQGYKMSAKTEKPMFFDRRGDHSVDALRYLCVGLLPQSGIFTPFSVNRRFANSTRSRLPKNQ